MIPAPTEDVRATAADESPPPTDAARTERRVGVMYGDRLCTTCNYNLIGQPVLREPHYDMLIVRCPECATVASVQEYPQLGRWAHRWAAMLSLMWLGVILAVSGGAFPAMIASTAVFADENVHRYEQRLVGVYEAWYEPRYGSASNTSRWNPDKFEEWLASTSPDQLLADAGGLWGAVRHPELMFFLIPSSFAFTYGCFMAVALVHRRRRTLMLGAVGLLIIAVGLYAVIWHQIATREPIERFNDLTFVQAFLPLLAIVYAWLWVLLAAGLLAGRSIARGLARILLPPPLRRSIAVLWTTDGLSPPVRARTAT